MIMKSYGHMKIEVHNQSMKCVQALFARFASRKFKGCQEIQQEIAAVIQINHQE